MGHARAPAIHDCNGRWAIGRSYVYVYMARDADGPMYVKIGRSDDPVTRVKGVQTGCPFRIVKAGMVKCLSVRQSRDLEAKAHAELAPFHSFGEWFRFDWTQQGSKEALFRVIEGIVSAVRDGKFEEIDLERAARMMRALESARRQKYRTKQRKAA